MLFIDRLIDKIIETRNPVVVGLDTQLSFIPERILRECRDEFGAGGATEAEAIFRFNKAIIDRVCDIAPAVKPQSAFYETYGSYGAEALIKTVRYAHDSGMLVIVDGKRGDIGSTAEAYANAYLGNNAEAYFADALTINPYIGYDCVEPFIRNCRKYDKGVFALVKTSNPSSGDFQDMELSGGKKAYEHIADLVQEWGGAEGLMGSYGYSSVCAVVGATYPEQAKKLRERVKRLFFLVPGYGAQGGSAEDAAAAFDRAGLGAIVNSSRGVLQAWSHERWDGKYAQDDFADAARAEVLRMKAEINKAIGANG